MIVIDRTYLEPQEGGGSGDNDLLVQAKALQDAARRLSELSSGYAEGKITDEEEPEESAIEKLTKRINVKKKFRW